MELLVDLDSRKFLQVIGAQSEAARVSLKRGDSLPLELSFVRDGARVLLSDPADIRFALRAAGDADGAPVAYTGTFTRPTDESGIYRGTLNLNTVEANALLGIGTDVVKSSVLVLGEVTWSEDAGASWKTSGWLNGSLDNDLIKGDEVEPEEAVGRGPVTGLLNLPRSMSKIYDLNRANFQGADHNFFTVFNLADSMGVYGFYPRFESIMANKLGFAGLGFERLGYSVTAGTVVVPSDPGGRRFDLWGFGNARQIQSGGVLEIGERFAGDQIRAFQCTKATFVFASEPGGGSVDLHYYDDSAGGWELLEAGVSTDAAVGPVIKTYTFSERSALFRVTGVSGHVEFIGAILRNVVHHGLVSCQAAIGGNPLTNVNQGDAGIFNAVMAEVEPDLILSQYDESAVGLEAAFGAYADAVNGAAASADHVYWSEHEIDSSGTKEASHWPIYRAKAGTIPALQILEAEDVLPHEMIDAVGWDDADPVHLDPEAWEYVAGVLARWFGFDPAYGNHSFTKIAQNGSTKIYRLGGITKSGNLVYEIPGFDENSVRVRLPWDDPEKGERWWEIERKARTDSDNPEGLSLNFFNSITSGEAVNINLAGRAYWGPSGNLVFDGRQTFFETWSARACIVTGHSGGVTASLFKGYSDLTLSNMVSEIKATGVARFKTLDVSDWEEAADDVAAGAAGVAIGEAYKTAAGELRVRIA